MNAKAKPKIYAKNTYIAPTMETIPFKMAIIPRPMALTTEDKQLATAPMMKMNLKCVCVRLIGYLDYNCS